MLEHGKVAAQSAFEISDYIRKHVALHMASWTNLLNSPGGLLAHSKRVGLSPIPRSFDLTSIQVIPFSSLTSYSPVSFIMIDVLRCWNHFVNFNAFFVFPDLKNILLHAKALCVPVRVAEIPSSLVKHALKLIWHSQMIGWQEVGGTEGSSKLLGDEFVDQLLYLLDLSFQEEIPSNLCYVSFEEDANTNLGITKTLTGELLEMIMNNDTSAEKWLHLCDRLFSRADLAIPNVAAAEPAFNPATVAAVKKEQTDSDNESEDGDENDPDKQDDEEGKSTTESARASPTAEVSTAAKSRAVSPQVVLEDVTGFVKNLTESSLQSALKCSWRIQLFLMDNLDKNYIRKGPDAYKRKVGDLIRLAFNVESNASVETLKVKALEVLESIVEIYGPMKDPDFPELSLLDQYQAQLNSAVSIAFDRSITGAAVEATLIPVNIQPAFQIKALKFIQTYLKAPICTNMPSRIAKVLTELKSQRVEELDKSKSDFVESPIAAAIIHYRVLECWSSIISLAESSSAHVYLEQFTAPCLKDLSKHWIDAIHDYTYLLHARALEIRFFFRDNRNLMTFVGYTSATRVLLAACLKEVHRLSLKAVQKSMETHAEFFEKTEDGPPSFFYEVMGASLETIVAYSEAIVPDAEFSTDALLSLDTLGSLFNQHVVSNLEKWLDDGIYNEILEVLDLLLQKHEVELTKRVLKFCEHLVKNHRGYVFNSKTRFLPLLKIVQHLSTERSLIDSLDLRAVIMELSTAMAIFCEDDSYKLLCLAACFRQLLFCLTADASLEQRTRRCFESVLKHASEMHKSARLTDSMSRLLAQFLSSAVQTAFKNPEESRYALFIAMALPFESMVFKPALNGAFIQTLTASFVHCLRNGNSTATSNISSIVIVSSVSTEEEASVARVLLNKLTLSLWNHLLLQKPKNADELLRILARVILVQKLQELKLALLKLVLPVFIAHATESNVAAECCVSLMSKEAGSFKQALDAIQPEYKSRLEMVIRQLLAGGNARTIGSPPMYPVDGAAQVPSIALKMDFSA